MTSCDADTSAHVACCFNFDWSRSVHCPMHKGICFLHVVGQNTSAFDVGVDLFVKDLQLELFCRSGVVFIDHNWCDGSRYIEDHLIHDGGTDVASVSVFSADIFSDALDGVHITVGLLVIRAIKNHVLQGFTCPVEFAGAGLRLGTMWSDSCSDFLRWIRCHRLHDHLSWILKT